MTTVLACLEELGFYDANITLTACSDLASEWHMIKRAFHAAALRVHPDKGGDEAKFRAVRTSFDVLRELFETGAVTVSFSQCLEMDTGSVFQHRAEEEERAGPPPPWEFYSAAAEETTPPYRVESAKSGRSVCQKCRNLIDSGATRVGWLDPVAGNYGRWCHITCWRVPYKVSLGLPQENLIGDLSKCVEALVEMSGVLIDGFLNLPETAKAEVARQVQVKENWAKAPPNRKIGASTMPVSSIKPPAPNSSSSTLLSGQLAVPGNRFLTPTPSVGSKSLIQGRSLCLTGTFPEIGGGVGLDLGKARVQQMIESFGGRVTKALSGKTFLLVVGKSPGYGKITDAKRRGIKLVSLHDLAEALRQGKDRLDQIPDFSTELRVRDFSTGFYGNGLAGRLLSGPDSVVQLDQVPEEVERAKTVSIANVLKNSKPRKAARTRPKRLRQDDDRATQKSEDPPRRSSRKRVARIL